MDNEKITVLVVEPEKKPYIKEIEAGLESLQREVGGYIQAVYPFDRPCAIVCGEDSKLNGKPLNRALRDEDGHIYDIIAGMFLIVGLGEEDFTSLSPKDIQEMSARFAVPETFMKIDGKFAVVPMEIPEPQSANEQLYHKMEAEFDTYVNHLLNLPPEEFLNHAYEYTAKQDILYTFENFDLTEPQAQALLKLPAPLDDIYKTYEKTETDLMEILQNCMEHRADALIAEQKKEEPNRIPPMYIKSAAYALKHDETDAYRESFTTNVACCKAIEQAISDHYHDNRLDVSCAKEIIDTFGMERVQTVLASTIQAIDRDGRISDANKKWAKTVPLPDEVGREYHVNNCHRGLTDLFCTEVRRIQREMERKLSVLGKLADTVPAQHKEKSKKAKAPER